VKEVFFIFQSQSRYPLLQFHCLPGFSSPALPPPQPPPPHLVTRLLAPPTPPPPARRLRLTAAAALVPVVPVLVTFVPGLRALG